MCLGQVPVLGSRGASFPINFKGQDIRSMCPECDNLWGLRHHMGNEAENLHSLERAEQSAAKYFITACIVFKSCMLSNSIVVYVWQINT